MSSSNATSRDERGKPRRQRQYARAQGRISGLIHEGCLPDPVACGWSRSRGRPTHLCYPWAIRPPASCLVRQETTPSQGSARASSVCAAAVRRRTRSTTQLLYSLHPSLYLTQAPRSGSPPGIQGRKHDVMSSCHWDLPPRVVPQSCAAAGPVPRQSFGRSPVVTSKGSPHVEHRGPSAAGVGAVHRQCSRARHTGPTSDATRLSRRVPATDRQQGRSGRPSRSRALHGRRSPGCGRRRPA